MTDSVLVTGSIPADVILGLLMIVVGYWAYRRRLARLLLFPLRTTQWGRKHDSRFMESYLRWVDRGPLVLVIIGMMIAFGAILG